MVRLYGVRGLIYPPDRVCSEGGRRQGAGQQASKTSHRAIHGMAVGNALLTVPAPPGAARDVHPWVERRARALEAKLARSVIPREGV